MPRYQAPSIEDQGGIAVYLNATRDQHHGIGWKLFDWMCQVHTPNAIIARLMAREKDNGEIKPLAPSTVANWKELRKRWYANKKVTSRK